LRHSTVSLLSAAGVPLEHIADVTGHDSTRTTGQVYRHLITPTVTAGVEPMERMFGRRP
jgi:integrase